nr:hypothetical protein [Tanacetum cinerariifolium]
MEREGDNEVSMFTGAEGSKRDAEEEFDQGSSKKQKTNEASGSVQEQQVKKEKELSQEDLQQKYWKIIRIRNHTEVELKRLFKPDVDDELWKLQRYMHDPLKWRLYDTCAVHHVSIKRGHDIFMLVEKDYPLIKELMTVMLVNKLQVDEFSEIENEILRNIFILANNPKL